MSKFNVLKYNQAFMAWLGIYSHNLLEPTNEFFKSFVAYFIVINLLTGLYGSAAFAEKNRSALLSAMKICMAAVQSIGSFLNIGLKMRKIKALHLALQQFVNEGMWFFSLALNLRTFLKNFHFEQDP